jgi:cobalt-zinc-cadmium efflux system protein
VGAVPHGSHDEHGHNYADGLIRAAERHRRPLLLAFGLTAVFLVVEVVAGFITGSLALLSDAGHMLTDVLGLGMALAAITVASRFASGAGTGGRRHTFGLYRLEILAAFVNALLLFGVAVWVLIEAVRRLVAEPEVDGTPMLVVAVLGLCVNLVAFALLRRGAKESLNVEGAYLEVLADAVGSVGVIVAAILLAAFGWRWVDPVVAVLIGLWIMPRTWRLGRRAAHVLLQSAPGHIDLARLEADLEAIADVVEVHDLHVWTLTSDMEAASAHIVTGDAADAHGVLDQARELLAVRYGITHGTFQIEPESHHGCSDVSW